jgi:two-component sensor histidine kinase/DNA-binding NarL/FixJ family response regulator
LEAAKGKILLVEDEEFDQITFKRFAQMEYFPYKYQIAGSVREACQLMAQEKFDIIVTDYMLGDGTAFDLLRIHKDVPFIIVTGAGNEQVAVMAIQSGIRDYLIKDIEGNYLKTLKLTLDNLFRKRQEEIELLRYRERLEELVAERTCELEAEITERKRIEAQISASLQDKEILLKEVHHRVKNNLQIIYNLLSLQSQYIKDPLVAEIFRESQNRIHSIALIHERLYRAKDLGKIDFTDYVRNLVQALYQTYHIERNRISYTFQSADAALGIDCAIPCGLILNELVSNSLKHAFPPDFKQPGLIEIQFKKGNSSEIELSFSDNGIGFSRLEDFNNPRTLGLRLVRLLVEEQLQGTIELFSDNGAKFLIKFCV